MPGVHRNGDSRKCGATTTVVGQSTYFVNGVLVSVDGDPCTHGSGLNKPVTGGMNVYAENKLIICAVGDTTYNADLLLHPPGVNDPLASSSDVIVY